MIKQFNCKVEKQCAIKNAIIHFSKKQSLTALQELKNLGIGLKVLKNSSWQKLSKYKLPLRFVPLYSDKFEITDLGIY